MERAACTRCRAAGGIQDPGHCWPACRSGPELCAQGPPRCAVSMVVGPSCHRSSDGGLPSQLGLYLRLMEVMEIGERLSWCPFQKLLVLRGPLEFGISEGSAGTVLSTVGQEGSGLLLSRGVRHVVPAGALLCFAHCPRPGPASEDL